MQMQTVMNGFNQITFSIIMIVVFIGILGVMYVSIIERLREFGIMISIGYSYSYIRLQILFEALFLGLGGFFFGSFFALLILGYLRYWGLDLTLFSDGLSHFGMDSILYASIHISDFIYMFLAIILSSILSIFLPLRTIKKLNPIDVMRSI